MPCNSDYMEPNERERQSRLTAELICYVKSCMGLTPSPEVAAASTSAYGDVANLDDFVKELCGLCSIVSPAQEDKIIYDGRSAKARKLADWWDRHQEADRRREAQEQREREDTAILAALKRKLSPEEQRVLGL